MIIAHTEKKEIELRCNQLFKEKEFNINKHNKNNFIAIDLLNVFLEIYDNDIKTKRKMDKLSNFSIEVYVNRDNLDVWNENKVLIETLVNFVTESDLDKWRIKFIPVNYEFRNQNEKIKINYNKDIDNISLLSGGLDSFCGAYNNEINNNKTIYCGYKTSNMDVSSINKVNSFLKNKNGYKGIDLYEHLDRKKKYPYQRTRSLLFFSVAVFSAIENDVFVIRVNENGIMSLNPSFESRGTTKTTHPKTIYLYQKLLNNIGLNIKLEHPFLFSTKGEMIFSLNKEFKENIKYTRSCGTSLQNVNYNIKGDKSCGACIPCLLRKISMAAYDLEKYDHEYVIPYMENSKIYSNFNGKKLDDYHSSFSYFKVFYNSILSNEIFSKINIKKSYYEDEYYLEKTQEMLKKFKKELEVFMRKYDDR